MRLLAFLCAVVLAAPAAARTVTIAVVRDGPGNDDALVPLVESELGRLLGAGDTARLLSLPEFDAGYTADGARRAIETAMASREVDLLLGLGILVTQEAARPELALRKPFVSAFAQRADLPKLPWSGDASLKPNLALVVIPQRAASDAAALLRMIPADRLYVGVDAELAGQVAGLETAFADYGRTLGVELVPVPIGDDPADAVAGLPPDARAFYVTTLPRLEPDRRSVLFDALAARGVAALSGAGHPDVVLGAFAALTPDVSEIVVRRVALNVSRIVRGSSTADLPVVLPVKTALLINGRTARAIGYVPGTEAMAYGAFLHPEALQEVEEPLALADAMRTAETSNASLAIRTAAAETSYREKQRALSPILPQVGANAGYSKARTVFPNSIAPEKLGSAGLYVSQMIWDDLVVSGYRASGRTYESSQLDREIERLDVLAQAAVAYLSLVQARALFRIEADNVRLTGDNLELAEVRYDVGYSGQDEVFRWQAELARRRGDLLNSDASIQQSRIALNQVLGVEQDRRWLPEDLTVEPGVFPFLGGRVPEVLDDVATARRFGSFLVELALEQSPELSFFDRLIEGQGIQVGARQRRFFLPAFYADFSYDYLFEWSPDLAERRDDTWTARVYATYPLFEGANRWFDLQRERSARRELEHQRELARQGVEQRTRTSFERVRSRFPVIGLSAEAARASRQNLEVVREKYAEGIVNVTDLLEAQNQSFTADQFATLSVYQFLVDLIDVQRSIAWFEFEKTDPELDELAAAVREAVAAP